jgi:hypothetical protein
MAFKSSLPSTLFVIQTYLEQLISAEFLYRYAIKNGRFLGR